jgi:hypothetical protein
VWDVIRARWLVLVMMLIVSVPVPRRTQISLHNRRRSIHLGYPKRLKQSRPKHYLYLASRKMSTNALQAGALQCARLFLLLVAFKIGKSYVQNAYLFEKLPIFHLATNDHPSIPHCSTLFCYDESPISALSALVVCRWVDSTYHGYVSAVESCRKRGPVAVGGHSGLGNQC